MPGTPTRNTNALRSNARSHPSLPCWANWTTSAIASMSGPTMNGHWSTTHDFSDGCVWREDGLVVVAMTTTYPGSARVSQAEVAAAGLRSQLRPPVIGADLRA